MKKTLSKEWKMVRLGEVCDIIVGKTPLRSVSKYWGNGKKWATISDIKDVEISETKETITDIAVSELRMKQLPAGTLIYSFKLSLGKTAFTREPMYTNEAIAGLIPKNKIPLNRRFLKYALSTVDISSAHHAAKGRCLNQKKLNLLSFSLPPLDTQHKIVAILDEADNLRKLRQKADEKMKDLIPSLFVEMFGDPITNPKGWELTELNSICSFKRGPFGGSLKKEIFVKSGFKVYEQKNAIYNRFDIGEYYIDEEKYNEMIAFAVQTNDLIVSCSGTMGKVAIVPTNVQKGIINQALLKITPNQNSLIPLYLKLILENEGVLFRFFGKTAGSAIQNVPPVGVIKKIEIPLPPLPLQQEFATRVEEIEAEKERQAESKKKLDELFNSLMQRAFTGELVA